MRRKKFSEAEAKKIISSANKALDAALVAAGEVQRGARRKQTNNGLSADDWRRLGLPGKGTTRTVSTAELRARLARVGRTLDAERRARLMRLGRALGKRV